MYYYNYMIHASVYNFINNYYIRAEVSSERHMVESTMHNVHV